MPWLNIVLTLYALFTGFAGMFGYLKSGSAVSAIAGLAAAALVLVGVWLSKTKPAIGYPIAGVVALAMIGRFLPSFLKAQDPYAKIWPDLSMVVASAIALLCLILGHVLAKKPA